MSKNKLKGMRRERKMDIEDEKKCLMSKIAAGREGKEAKMDIEGEKKCPMSKREQVREK